MATFEEFLRTGQLGPLRLGMTKAEAIAQLGEPPDESIQREPKILKYGGLQITFARPSTGTEPRLKLIGLYYHPPLEPVPAPVSPTDFTGTSETGVAEVREFLGQIGITEATEIDGDDIRLTLPSGVQITFGDQKLWNILFAARIPAAQKKQISVSIPEDAWQQLHTLARQSKQSISELCAQWITQRANESQAAG